MSPDTSERLAAEWVLGLLEGEEERTAERLMETDPIFAARVETWRVRFAELDAGTAERTPSPDLWSRIDASLDAAASEPSPAAASAPTPVAESAPARPAVRGREIGAAAGRRWRDWWDSVAVWRGFGLASAAAALALGIGLAAALREDARRPVLVAILVTDENQPAAVVNAFADGRAELVPLNQIPVPAGRALQIWTLWDRARGPVSVGLLDRAHSVTLGLDGLPRPAADQLFEITLEPASGSPTGRPTGPVLMKGLTTRAL